MPRRLSARACRRLAAAAALVLALRVAHAVPTDRETVIEVPMRTIAMVFGFSLLGGFVSWITKIRNGTINGWSLMQLVGELCTSAFAGALCFLLCDQAGVSLRLTVCLVGVAGHMGTRAIVAFEGFAERKWGAIAGGPPKDQP